MFGSLFRSAVVIGTIYAISPVKLDATPHPAAAPVPAQSKSAAAGQAQKTGFDLPAQAAGLAPQLMAAAVGSTQSKGSADQIGDLITLGKDLCLANPGLCVEAAKALHDSKPQEKTAEKTAEKASQKIAPAPKPVESAKAKQPDALAALIEKTVTPPAPALAKPLR